MNLAFQRVLVAGYLFLLLSSCTSVKIDNHILMDDLPQQVMVNKTTVKTETPSESTKVIRPVVKRSKCVDSQGHELKDYKLPPIPDADQLPEGDSIAAINLLLDHIELLRNELREIPERYTCK